MKKRILSILLSCILIVTLITGCTGDQTDDPGKQTDKPVDTKTAEPVEEGFVYDGSAPITEEPLTISWVCSNTGVASGDMDFENMAWLQEILRLANVELDMEILDPASYGDAIKPRLAAGIDLPDVIQMPSTDTDMTYVNSGMFLELTDLYGKYAVNLSWRFEDNPTVMSQMTTPDGKVFYVPVINMSLDYIPNLLIQSEWLENLNLDVPATTDQFYDVLTAFKTQDPNGNDENDENPMYFSHLSYFNALGAFWGLELNGAGFIADDNGQLESSFTSERYRDFLEYWNRAYEEGLINSDFSTSTYDMINERMANDTVGVSMVYINFAQTYARLLNPEIDVKNDSLIMTPMLPLEGPYGHRYYRGNDPIAGYFAINKNCENPEAVFSFLDYIFSEEANSLMFYGLEDEDYEVIDGKIVPDLEKRTTDNYANRMGNNFGGFPRILLAAHRDVSYMPEIAVYNKQIHEYNKLPDVLTSFFLPDEIEVIQQYDTDIITYFNEMLVSFVTGETDLSTFDDYVATAESMGLSQLLEAYQSRYERTKAAGN